VNVRAASSYGDDSAATFFRRYDLVGGFVKMLAAGFGKRCFPLGDTSGIRPVHALIL
jgi:hypothetical protein